MEHRFADLAPKLFKLGYEVIPIAKGEKRPGFDGWQEVAITPQQITAWCKEFPNGNVGIRTKHTPAIDIDVLDEKMAAACEAIADLHFHSRCTRVGMEPKRLLAFRTDTPFRKIVLKLVDPSGVKHKVEVLGEGQQFVAFGIHPDTKQPYTWTSFEDLTEVPRDKLPLLTPQIVDDYFDQVEIAAKKMGWSVVPRQRGAALAASSDDDNALVSYSPPAEGVTIESMAEMLKVVPNPEEHDHWLQVIMALHHQFDGSPEALELAHEWSAQAGNYDREALDYRWRSFGIGGHTPTTARYIIKIASEKKAAVRAARFDGVIAEVQQCSEPALLLDKLSMRLARMVENEIELDMLVDAVVERAKELGKRVRRDTIKKRMRMSYVSIRINRDCPEWCKNWVYVSSEERFYNIKTHQSLSERAFNSMFNRNLLTKGDLQTGKFTPEYSASVVALNQHQIQVVDRYGYMPGAEPVYEIDGVAFINTYDIRGIPDTPEEYSPEERKAVKMFTDHIALLLPNAREARLFTDWLSFIVQSPAQKAHWGVLLQGVEGAGKSFFSVAMSAVIGYRNVGNVSPTALRGDFTGWAEGRRLVVVEEIRLHGENRYALLDKLKPYVTNSIVPIRRMRTDEYNIPNVTDYLQLTNHFDALPISRTDRRNLALSTSFQTKEDVMLFDKQRPNYFQELFDAVQTHRGAIRKFLLEHQQSEEFHPFGRAPDTEFKALMSDMARGEDSDDLESLLENSGDPLVNCYVLNQNRLKELAAERMVLLPAGRLGVVLTNLGYIPLGRARLPDGTQPRFWSKHPNEVKTPGFQAWLDRYLDDSIFT